MIQPLRAMPSQAVILAGGRGTRLRPLTDDRPKPMVGFHGRPFLEYLVEMLRDQGFKEILMLLGYLPQVIERHFGDGRRFGVPIRYSVSEPDDLTSRRLQIASDQLADGILLLYCDNYWPLDMGRHWARYLDLGAPVMTTIYVNDDRYSRDNVRIDVNGRVEVFDRTRSAPGLKGIEISYAIMPRAVLELLPADGSELVEQALYPRLAAEGQLGSFLSRHRYYSVGALHRLPLTAEFLARRPTVILDRDGVLNERPARATYVRRPEDFRWLPGALEALRMLRDAGYRTIVVSNQAGIARGEMSETDLDAIHERMRREALGAGGRIDEIYYCPHDWGEGCDCRKPQPGMLFRAQHELQLDLSRTPFIGDDERDGQAAAMAGCPFLEVGPSASLLDCVRTLTASGFNNPIHDESQWQANAS
jgi:histidinol-phosphate phosphatase family protein